MGRWVFAAMALAALSALPIMSKAATIAKASYGTLADGSAVEVYTLQNGHGMTVKILTYGGIINEIDVPDRSGKAANVVLGYRNLDGYVKEAGTYFGAIIGRYGNRIAKGHFTLDGKQYTLAINNDPNALHGGLKGFDKAVWTAASASATGGPAVLRLTHVSPDGDQGYPGTLKLQVTYTLGDDNALGIAYQATTDKDTVLNLTNHTYFNLAGEASGDVMNQELTILADRYTPVDATLIPTGELAPVAGTPFDFRKPKAIGLQLRDDNAQLLIAHGYDHNWVLGHSAGAAPSLAVRGYDPASGRTVEILTTEPGVQVYTGNFLVGAEAGTSGKIYRQTDGWTAETQHYPDSPNHPAFPTTELRPGQTFNSQTIFRFSAGAHR